MDDSEKLSEGPTGFARSGRKFRFLQSPFSHNIALYMHTYKSTNIHKVKKKKKTFYYNYLPNQIDNLTLGSIWLPMRRI